MLRSSIDLGTNTCLLLIADYDGKNPSGLKIHQDFSTIVRLGEGVDKNRSLQPEAIQRTLECLTKYSEYVKKAGLNPASTICIATSSARDAKNGMDFFKTVEKETGFRFSIISGDQEARLTHLGGLLPGMDPEKSVVIDIGGGSTEVISHQEGQSLDIGSVRFTERFLKSDPVTDDEFNHCQMAIDKELNHSKLPKTWGKQKELVAVAGTATTLAAWRLGLNEFDPNQIDQARLTVGDITELVQELKKRTVSERKKLTGIEAKRADVLLAGAMILWRTMHYLNFSYARISTRGIRFGAILSSR
jgi:exopolyphosphatase / guanosine-5'-triphosphate,3'-diphosphate pyrophosphatase